MDQKWWDVMGDDAFKKFKGEFIAPMKVHFKAVRHKSVKNESHHKAGNSGAGALSLAVYYGAERVILLGCDCKYAPDGKRHWHGNHDKRLGNAVSVPKFYGQYQELARVFFRVSIINCSPDSAIDFWPKMTIEEALNGQPVAAGA